MSSTPVPSTPVEKSVEAVPETPKRLEKKTLFGCLPYELYERLLKPSLVAYSLRQDEEPLRQLAESIVTSIAMHDAYDGYRKIDDICQRYLYYLESVNGASKKTWEFAELSALRDYWRSQVFMMMIRDASTIFEILLPRTPAVSSAHWVMLQDRFLAGVEAVFHQTLNAEKTSHLERTAEGMVWDFAHGVSFPWLGFEPSSVFGLQHVIPDDEIEMHREMAIADVAHTECLKNSLEKLLYRLLYIDLIYAQHHKLYDEIAQGFDGDERLQDAIFERLNVRFDRAYQTAYASILSGGELTKSLHRSSRLDVQKLNDVSHFAAILREATEKKLGVYLFHFVG